MDIQISKETNLPRSQRRSYDELNLRALSNSITLESIKTIQEKTMQIWQVTLRKSTYNVINLVQKGIGRWFKVCWKRIWMYFQNNFKMFGTKCVSYGRLFMYVFYWLKNSSRMIIKIYIWAHRSRVSMEDKILHNFGLLYDSMVI